MLNILNFKCGESQRFSHYLNNGINYNALKDISKPNTINVTIGSENPRIELQDFSIITANIAVDKRTWGYSGLWADSDGVFQSHINFAQVTEYLSRILSAML